MKPKKKPAATFLKNKPKVRADTLNKLCHIPDINNYDCFYYTQCCERNNFHCVGYFKFGKTKSHIRFK